MYQSTNWNYIKYRTNESNTPLVYRTHEFEQDDDPGVISSIKSGWQGLVCSRFVTLSFNQYQLV